MTDDAGAVRSAGSAIPLGELVCGATPPRPSRASARPVVRAPAFVAAVEMYRRDPEGPVNGFVAVDHCGVVLNRSC
jgi:hypothetical protein